ncbi:hypothetical protein [Streptomyces nodosus]
MRSASSGSRDVISVVSPRVHVGAYRVMYEISDLKIRVSVIHLGRVC